MNHENIAHQPLLNFRAFGRSLGMWLMPWAGLVLFLTYQGQPFVICLTPMACTWNCHPPEGSGGA